MSATSSILLYVGLLVTLLGALSLLVPLKLLRITSRRRGAVVLLFGLAIALAAAAWPARTVRVARTGMLIDEVMPAYQFHELHSIRVRASPARVFRAFRRVTPGDIRFFNTLMAIRSLPERLGGGGRPQSAVPGYAIASYARGQGDTLALGVDGVAKRFIEGPRTSIDYEVKPGGRPVEAKAILDAYREAIRRRRGSEVVRDSCCHATFVIGAGSDTAWIAVAARQDGRSFRLTILAPGGDRSQAMPLLDLFTRSGFLVLAEEPDCEVVLGAVDRYWKSAGGGERPRIEDARAFRAFRGSDYAKVAFNLRVTDQGGGWCRVTSETRIVGTDPGAGHKFAAYWRFIYPGSAIIRRSLLDAIKRRAERGT